MALLEKRRLAVVLASCVALTVASVTPASAHQTPLVWDTALLSQDSLDGRVTGTTGSTMAQDYIKSRLEAADYRVDNNRLTTHGVLGGGTDILARLPGSGALANDGYVLIGAHYDHVGRSDDPGDPGDQGDPRCTHKGDPADLICNGATDNAAGVAVLLDIATHLAESAPASRREVVFMFWDAEEDAMQGSLTRRLLIEHGLGAGPPIAYVNYDIQGANLRTSLRDVTIAVGASSGGPRLRNAVTSAAGSATGGRALTVRQLTEPFGLYRSDYANYLAPQVTNNSLYGEAARRPELPDLPEGAAERVPTVFFSDGSGPCYHTPQDEGGVVDFQKLERQADIGNRLVRDLATGAKPTIQPLPAQAEQFGEWVGSTAGAAIGLVYDPDDPADPDDPVGYPKIPPPTYDDAKELLELFNTAEAGGDIDPAIQAAIDYFQPALTYIKNKTSTFYLPLIDGPTVALAAFAVMPLMEQGVCDGFLEP